MGSSNLEYELCKLLSREPWVYPNPVELPHPLAGAPLRNHQRHARHPSMYPVKTLPTEPTICQVVIPHTYQRLPILSRLISRFGVTVNILGAALPSWRPSRADCQGEFVLAVGGHPQQQAQAMDYLKTLKVQFVPRRDLHLPPQWHRLSGRHPITLAKGCERLRLHLHIPAQYHHQPMLSGLVKDCGVAITILGASLPSQGNQDGWFDLELWGLQAQFEAVLATLNRSDCGLWLPD
ncbi:MAG: hypothetical protein RLZZ597_3505 [Cyanobacteriota bacterium]|jgi:hypothetical protein